MPGFLLCVIRFFQFLMSGPGAIAMENTAHEESNESKNRQKEA
jgi:hypothetical protein